MSDLFKKISEAIERHVCGSFEALLAPVHAKLDTLTQIASATHIQGVRQMAEIQDILKNLQDIRGIGKQYLDLIIAKDAMIADLKVKEAEAIAKLSLSEEQKAEIKAGLDAVWAESEAAENELREGIPGVPPIGGVALQTSYAGQAAFDEAVAAYTGSEAITLDGNEVKTGTSPAIDFFSHSATGEINTSGPAD